MARKRRCRQNGPREKAVLIRVDDDEKRMLQDAARRRGQTVSLTVIEAVKLLDAIDACMKTGERQTTRAVDVWRAAPDLPVFGVHVSIDGASWTCGAVRGWDVDGPAFGGATS